MAQDTGEAGGPGPVIIGAGPAGLTAAYQLAERGIRSTVLEAGGHVGGLSRTVVRDGWRFDIGGHRFFTKVKAVSDLWHEILGPEDFLVRPRLSRIYYRGKFYNYPLDLRNALSNLGLAEAARCAASYLWVRLRPPADRSTFEGFTAARFGWRLYRTFFKTYTEKVWGVPADEIQADWAAQRIKNLNLFRAAVNGLLPRRKPTGITSLIEQFHYPRHGPGMMWERCAELVTARGSQVRLDHPVRAIHHRGGRAAAVVAEGPDGDLELAASHVVSSMPISRLVQAMAPAPPGPVLDAARALGYRDFLTVALVVPADRAFPDNWIYVHEPGVAVGRVQNFGSWSPDMVRDDGWTCLGLEYFVFEGDELWSAPDGELVERAKRELDRLGLVSAADVGAGYVVRVPKAYPMYDAGYRENVNTLRSWLSEHAANVWPVGRNGMHRYNNQDHSMYTAMLAVENIAAGADHDIWAVNVEAEYHEESHEKPRPEPRRRPRSAAAAAPPGPGAETT